MAYLKVLHKSISSHGYCTRRLTADSPNYSLLCYDMHVHMSTYWLMATLHTAQVLGFFGHNSPKPELIWQNLEYK